MPSKKIVTLAPDHIYVPKHEIMTKKDAEVVLEKYHCKTTDLPLIFVNDPAIIGLGVKPGDMIKIDIHARSINLMIEKSEIAERMAKIPEFQPKISSGYLGRYARMVSSADTGAVLI